MMMVGPMAIGMDREMFCRACEARSEAVNAGYSADFAARRYPLPVMPAARLGAKPKRRPVSRASSQAMARPAKRTLTQRIRDARVDRVAGELRLVLSDMAAVDRLRTAPRHGLRSWQLDQEQQRLEGLASHLAGQFAG